MQLADTMGAWLRGRFPAHVDVQGMLRAGRYRYRDGGVVHGDDPYRPRTEIWFERDLPDEREVSGTLDVIYQDERILVVDKPPFLATIPRGSHVRQTVVSRLRDELGEPELQPAHRLDRLTSGLVLLTRQRRWRGAYQDLFEQRGVHKTYRALALAPAFAGAPAFSRSPALASSLAGAHSQEFATSPLPAAVDGERGSVGVAELETLRARLFSGAPIELRSRIEKRRGVWQAEEVPGEVNAITRIRVQHQKRDVVESNVVGADAGDSAVVEFLLEPETGRTHQLRVHLNRLGLPILGDPLYPNVRSLEPGGPPEDDWAYPLQLLAAEMAFTDPVDGAARHFTAGRRLPIVPDA